MTIRDSLSRHFSVAIQSMTFMSYLTYLNSAGKITQRSLLEILIIICEQVEEQEKREEQYAKNFKDIEDILLQVVGKTEEPTHTDILEKKPDTTQPIDPQAYVCDVCGKSFKAEIGLRGHSRSHK